MEGFSLSSLSLSLSLSLVSFFVPHLAFITQPRLFVSPLEGLLWCFCMFYPMYNKIMRAFNYSPKECHGAKFLNRLCILMELLSLHKWSLYVWALAGLTYALISLGVGPRYRRCTVYYSSIRLRWPVWQQWKPRLASSHSTCLCCPCPCVIARQTCFICLGSEHCCCQHRKTHLYARTATPAIRGKTLIRYFSVLSSHGVAFGWQRQWAIW